MLKETPLREISTKIEKDCTFEILNAFSTREKYFVSFPFDSSINPIPKNDSSTLMAPYEREIRGNEIK